ncbi:MAG: 4-hydroxy-tetrahydrodipicolinate synthase [Planctomycetota bacterium]|nr:4-hydroxy-tetrahydrodipicolinate synthase [Planctomycetota bacterium]MDA1262297.1 4-hydroxy-tetrahydrodipicolinate synthase [Planctomycetota bacterium]
MLTFAGAYTALITPFSRDGATVDLPRLAEHIHFQAKGGVRGIVPCGTTGEAPTLDEHEHIAVVECAVKTGRPLGLQVIAGAGSNSTSHAIHLHKLAASLGAHASLQVTPYYNKPSQEGIYQHFMAIADSAELPIVLYNIPGRSAVVITPETIERLSKHPNIVALKEATGSMDSASEIRRRCSIVILSGDDSLTASFAAVGAVGVVSVVSNLVPDRVAQLCRNIANNDLAAVRNSHENLFGLSRGLLSLDVNPVPLKCAMELLGRDTGSVRLPLVRASDAIRSTIATLIQEARISNAHEGENVGGHEAASLNKSRKAGATL